MRNASPIISSNFCHHGCGNVAKFVTKTGKEICAEYTSKCPEVKKKNSENLKKAFRSGKRKPMKVVYDSLPQSKKDSMNHNKGKNAKNYEPVQKRLETWKKNYHSHRGNSIPRGFAANENLRWKRNAIPYIDSGGNNVILDSFHELEIANILDKNNVKWIRPKPLHLKDGRKYEPDFYLIDYFVYLDPKSIWDDADHPTVKAIRKNQLEQVQKISLCAKENNVCIIILYSENENSHSWDGIVKEIQKSIKTT